DARHEPEERAEAVDLLADLGRELGPAGGRVERPQEVHGESDEAGAARQGNRRAGVRAPRVAGGPDAVGEHHCSSSVIRAAIWSASPLRIWPTTRPSARNSTVSAYDAASGSWV